MGNTRHDELKMSFDAGQPFALFLNLAGQLFA